MSQHDSGTLRCGRYTLDLSHPVVMGILNVTPDSFSDGGRYHRLDAALRHAEAMVAQGAAIIDVGGESTRPGATAIGVAQEIDRTVPVIEGLVKRIDVPISIDTSKGQVIAAAALAGASFINDTHALRQPGALAAAAATELPICLMHMAGEPRTMQNAPQYTDVVDEVNAFFERRIQDCVAQGIRRERIVLDPGFGFGKTLKHNLTLLAELSRLQRFGLPVMIGISRKSMLGRILDAPTEQRLAGGLAAATMAMERGAKILRVHDVAPHVDIVSIFRAVHQ